MPYLIQCGLFSDPSPCAIISHVHHVKYTEFHINTIFMHNVDFKSDL